MARILLVILFTSFASTVFANEYNRIHLEHNSQRPGGDYTNFITSSAEECVEKCEKSSRCRAFDFHKSDNSCWLKSRAYSARRYDGVVSGVKRRYSPQIKSVQELLTQQNYNPGTPDGLMGAKTRIALENYQKDHSISVTGQIDEATLFSLGLATSKKEVVPQSPAVAAPEPEISEEFATENLFLNIKTVGVTYLQLADNIYADVLARIPVNTILQVLVQKGEWYKVSYKNQVGYILAESVEKQ